MGNMWQPHQRDQRGFFERNAGKLLIWAFVAGVPLNAVGMAMDAGLFLLLGRAAFAILIVLAITGYIQRGSSRK